MDRDVAVVHLECHILDQESPDFVAESICIQASLLQSTLSAPNSNNKSVTAVFEKALVGVTIYLELKPALDVLLKRLGNSLVKVAQDLHRQLRVNALLANQVVQRVSQGEPDTANLS